MSNKINKYVKSHMWDEEDKEYYVHRIVERQANTIRFLQRQLSEQKLLETALRKRIAYLLNLIHHLYGELRNYVKIDKLTMDLIESEREAYIDYFTSEKPFDEKIFAKISLRFIPFIYQYIVETERILKYNEFIDWLRKNYPRLLKYYSYETITRSIRYLVEKGYLKRLRKGEFLITEKTIQYVRKLSMGDRVEMS